MKKIMIAVALMSLIAGCATDSKAHIFNNAARVHIGMTRQEVVKAMEAKPDRIVDSGNRYVYADNPDSFQSGRSVSIQFNNEGKTSGAAIISNQ